MENAIARGTAGRRQQAYAGRNWSCARGSTRGNMEGEGQKAIFTTGGHANSILNTDKKREKKNPTGA